MAEPTQNHHNQGQEGARGPERELQRTVAIYSDPGRTSMIVGKVLKAGSEDLAPNSRIKHEQLLLPLRDDATLDLESAQQWARHDGADFTVLVVEIPRTAARKPKTVELHFAESLAVISLPALGPFGIRRALRRELHRAINALICGSVDEARRVGNRRTQVEQQKGYETGFITTRRVLPGRLWMALGMAAANEPLWALPKLSGIFAAAAATGAFGIFFSTIWEMANSLPNWRLTLVSAVAISVQVLWLMISNRLWDRPATVGGKREAVLYNASTVISLLISVATLYLLLFLGILAMGFMLISPGFLAETIGDDRGLAGYLNIAWLSASLGTVAGAIGSNFDNDADLRNLTQGTREVQRYPRDDH